MSKKRANRLHGHYCKICGEYKASGRHIDTILKVAKIFNVPVDIVTR